MSVRIRAGSAGDHAALAGLFPELRIEDPAPDQARWQRDMMPNVAVAEEGGDVVGVVWPHPLGEIGNLRIVIVAPSARSRGVGKALMEHARRHLLAHGCREWRLNVMADNAHARALYEKLGFSVVHASARLRVPWSALERLPRSSRAVVAGFADPADDPAVERALDVNPGWLADGRGKDLHLFFRLADPTRPGEVTGFARFTPSFPSSHPFFSPDPAHAAALLETMRAHALHHDHVNVVVDRNDALIATLRAAGATGPDMVHMRGAL